MPLKNTESHFPSTSFQVKYTNSPFFVGADSISARSVTQKAWCLNGYSMARHLNSNGLANCNYRIFQKITTNVRNPLDKEKRL